LLYAEAINELEGPDGPSSAEMFKYIDLVRERAGIPGVKEAWDNYSDSPGYYTTQYGMRQIIHRERLIELAFEGQRFWDLRRWKEAPMQWEENVCGWNVNKQSVKEQYYTSRELFKTPSFTIKDYFWPIANADIEQNPNLVQNIGW
ncbi:MAG: RagB/SusD family nutrient uptake outer membrane protein, partial [Bacteroidales bacterium]|nr:RagB/SusD family nutrient uptake outer membrane protein [Bacteroidales bacterium]